MLTEPTPVPETTEPEVPEARANLVKEWLEKIQAAKEHWKDAFKQMRENQNLAARGASKEWIEAGEYVVPIIARHINLCVSQLYAKNPTAVAKRRRKLMYQLWDEKPESLQMASDAAAVGDPNGLAVLQEVAAAQSMSLMLDRMGRTLELLWDYFMGEQSTNYKQQLKAMVRRTKVCKVAYIKLGFQRLLKPMPENTAAIEDVTSKIAAIEATLSQIADDKIDETSARMEELRTNLEDLQKPQYLVAREGPVFDFPRSNEIIIDPACRHLKTFAGARWIAQEFEMSADRILEIYKVKVTGAAKAYYTDGRPYDAPGEMADTLGDKVCYRVYEVQDKRNKQCLTVCEGHKDFLKGPYSPEVDIERFWTVFPLVFNEIEHDEELYPPSDVELARHIQLEYNRARQALREHRIAARPYWVEDGTMETAEKDKLQQHAAHAIITVPSLAEGQSIDQKLQAGPTATIDPNLYETEMHFTDLLRVVGTQEANLGGIAGGTATESSIAEQSRSTSLAENVDDLDELLSDVAAAFGQLCLKELAKETVVEIVGEGAVWPEMPPTREEVMKDLLLTIKAGSSGRPNQTVELANLERATPLLIQVPGISPKAIAEKYAPLLNIDINDLYLAGLPSISALNSMMTKTAPGGNGGEQPTGDSQTDPNQQGGRGGMNAPNPVTNEPGPQPAYPVPMAVAA